MVMSGWAEEVSIRKATVMVAAETASVMKIRGRWARASAGVVWDFRSRWLECCLLMPCWTAGRMGEW